MGWTKLYSFGEKISEPESWSRTNLDFMTGAELTYDNLLFGIYGPGQYWQSDQYEVDVNYGTNYPQNQANSGRVILKSFYNKKGRNRCGLYVRKKRTNYTRTIWQERLQ